MLRRAIVLASLLLLPAAIPPAWAAGESVQDQLARARDFREKKDIRSALGWIGRAVATAHAAGDLLGEQEAAKALDDITGSLDQREPLPGAPATDKGPPDHRDAMVLLMEVLDPKRTGAFVSAHSLAREILLFSTEFSDGGHTAEAEKVLDAWSRVPKVGAAARFLQVWSDNVDLANHLDDMVQVKRWLADVDRQVAIGVAEGWALEVTHLVTETAVIYGRWRLEKEAIRQMEEGERVSLAAKDSVVVARWQRAARAMLGGVLEPVQAPVKRLLGKFAPIPAGAGGAGKPVAPTGLGLAFPKLKVQAPLVTVTRTNAGFEVVPAWGSRVPVTQPRGPGVRFLDLDGLILFFTGPGVGLQAVDLEGGVAKPGDGYPDVSLRALHLLARGETWTLRKDGSVTITK